MQPEVRNRAAPKADAIRRLASAELGPVLQRMALRAKRTGGAGGWARPEGDGWLVVWLQFSKWNILNSPEGNEFTLEMQLDNQPLAGSALAIERRCRLIRLITDEEREEHRSIQNAVLAKCRVDEGILSQLPPKEQRLMRQRSERNIAQRDKPYPPTEDVWFRYTDEHDVRQWLRFIGNRLPDAIDRFLDRARGGRSD